MDVLDANAEDVRFLQATRHGEVLTPVISPWLAQQIREGQAPPLSKPEHLSAYTLAEEDDVRPSAEYLSWRHWLQLHGVPALQPAGWLYLNFTYQQIQAALAGQGIALARLALVGEPLARGELVEPFGPGGRITSPFAYWLVRWPARRERPELAAFEHWLLEQAAATRAALESRAAEMAPALR